MKHALLSIAFLLLPTLASAQPEIEESYRPPSKWQVSAGAALPVGDASEVLGVAFAALGSYHHSLNPQLVATGRTGLMFQTGDGVDVIHIPLLGGVEYAISPEPNHVFLSAELGLVYLRGSVDTGFGTATDSEVELGTALGAGYRFGQMDVSATLYVPSLDEVDDSIHVMARVGYRL